MYRKLKVICYILSYLFVKTMMILSKIKKIINTLKRNPKFYPLELFVFNILKPSRTIARLRNNKSGRFNFYSILDSSSYLSPKSSISPIVKFNHSDKERTMELALNSLKVHGAVVIDSLISDQEITAFLNAYKSELSKITNKSNCRYKELKITNELISIWLNPWLYKLLSKYYGINPFCSNYPELWHVDNTNSSEKIAAKWHIDHCSKTGLQQYLHDIEPDGSTMEILSGSHRLPNLPRTFDDNWINNSGFDVLRLYGKKGSVQIHDPNVIHRASPRLGSTRTSLSTVFSWGENIKFSANRLSYSLKESEIEIENLELYQRKALIGLYPLMPFKGYQITKEGFICPQKRKSI